MFLIFFYSFLLFLLPSILIVNKTLPNVIGPQKYWDSFNNIMWVVCVLFLDALLSLIPLSMVAIIVESIKLIDKARF